MSVTLDKSLEWFKKLPLERQLHIVAKVLEESPASLGVGKAEEGFIYCILTEASVIVSTNTTEDAKQKILRWNLEDAVVTLLVEKLRAARPPPQVDAKALMQFDDVTFGSLIDGILNELYLKSRSPAEIANICKVNPSSVDAALRIIRDNLIFHLIRSEMGTDTLRQRVESIGFQGTKAEILTNKIQEVAPRIERTTIFRNTQDTYFAIRALKESVDAIRADLKQLIEIIKKAAEPSRYVG